MRGYATAHPDFPHESTADQWFSESQFESYRSLGFEIADEVLDTLATRLNRPANPTLGDLLAGL